MVLVPEKLWLEHSLVLRDRSNIPFNLQVTSLILIKSDGKIIECHLTFDVSPKKYQYINTEELFNLKPQMRGSVQNGQLLSEIDFQIEVMLKPNLLFSLIKQATSIQEIANYILQLSQEKPNHPLLLTENWLCLSVKQPTAPGEPSYQTFWADLSPTTILEAGTSSEEISTRIVNFFQTWAEADLAKSNQQNPLDTLEKMVDVLKDLADFGNGLVSSSSNISTQRDQASDTGLQPSMVNQQILEEVIHFFTEDDWSFTKIQGQSALQIGCQGKNGEWNCYAKAHEDEQQFVFYSLCPIAAPVEKRSAIAEFLTRANYGMTIGNFELDFEDGEIRYKTSIDVQGDFLSFELIKQLVYANVTMMDEYLPGIKSVIEDDVEPKDAIAQIESQPE